MTNTNREIIVIGGNHHNTLGVVRALGEKGLTPILILVTVESKPFVSYSKYIKRTIQIASNDLIPDTLLTECKCNKGKAVVICCSDASSGIVDEKRDLLSPFFILPGAEKQGQISFLMSKKEMANLAEKCGIKTPDTCYGNDIEKENSITPPCIVKPLVSKNGYKDDIHICNNWDEIRKVVKEIGPERVQIQQYIDKQFEYQLIGCSTGLDVIIPGVSIILRPCKGSNTSFLYYKSIEDGFCEIEKCVEFVKATGYKGLFSIEFLRDKEGRDYFMEITFRNDGNAICVTEAGVNLPYIWYLSSVDKDYMEEALKEVKPS